MKIVDGHLELNQPEAAAWGVAEAAIPLAQITFGAVLGRTRTLERYIAEAKENGLRQWFVGHVSIDPTGQTVTSLERDIEAVYEGAGMVLAYEIEVVEGMPHEPAPEVTYKRRRRK